MVFHFSFPSGAPYRAPQGVLGVQGAPLGVLGGPGPPLSKALCIGCVLPARLGPGLAAGWAWLGWALWLGFGFRICYAFGLVSVGFRLDFGWISGGFGLIWFDCGWSWFCHLIYMNFAWISV